MSDSHPHNDVKNAVQKVQLVEIPNAVLLRYFYVVHNILFEF